MTKAELVAKMQDAAARGSPGKTVKIDFGGDEASILLDGADEHCVSEDRRRGRHARSSVSWDDWQAAGASGHARRNDRVHDWASSKVEGDMWPTRCSCRACLAKTSQIGPRVLVANPSPR